MVDSLRDPTVLALVILSAGLLVFAVMVSLISVLAAADRRARERMIPAIIGLGVACLLVSAAVVKGQATLEEEMNIVRKHQAEQKRLGPAVRAKQSNEH